jgi:hypothetical protein
MLSRDHLRFALACADNVASICTKIPALSRQQRTYLKYYFEGAALRIRKRVFGKVSDQSSRYGDRIMTRAEGNAHLYQALMATQPFMAARFGSTELRALVQYEGVELGLFRYVHDVFGKYLCKSSGFFPNEQSQLMKFGSLMREAARETDLLGIWYNHMEDYFARFWLASARLTVLSGFEPYPTCEGIPWTKALAGRKVLVIHPFVDSIRKQYETNRERLFANKDILPKFDLHTVRAVQTVENTQSEFQDWFAALDSMVEQARQVDYDVAIIGAGAYGYPLAARIKQQGKQAIHIGGSTQVLFGIRGRRWDQLPKVAAHFNEYWVYPMAHERPANAASFGVKGYWA